MMLYELDDVEKSVLLGVGGVMRRNMETEVDTFMSELQGFLNTRRAALFFGEQHAEVWKDGERIGAITHEDGNAELARFECDC